MKKLPKGPLKVIEMHPLAVIENERRSRVAGTPPRRLKPTYSVRTERGVVEGYGVRINGEVRGRYETTKFPHNARLGHHTVRQWFETHDAVEVATEPGELDTKQETNVD